ncbi:MAG: hypothetical protein GXY83_34330 [Rhodopirellula sp.]|nr:hypothetical protein [Rhodopirellula sp.]
MHRSIALMCLALVCPAAAETIRIPLTLEDTAGCRITSRRAELLGRVPTANRQGYVVIDGRQPTRFSRDLDAPERAESGLLNSDFVRYDFHVPAAGTYAVFVRITAPPGRSRFVEVLDGRQYCGPHLEENGGSEPATRWIARPKVRLAAGLHRLALAASGYRAPPIAGIVLAPEAAEPPTDELPQATFHEIDVCEVRTAALLVPGLQGVKSLDGVPAGAAIRWTDADAEAWQPLPAGGLSVSKPVRFSIRLDAARPAIGPLAIQVDVDPQALIRLAQDGSELLLDRATGDFFMLYDRAHDRLLAGGGRRQPLAAVQFKKAGEAQWTQVGPDRTLLLKQKQKYALGDWHLETVSETERRIDPEAVTVGDNTVDICHVFAAEGLGRARVTQRIAPEGNGVWRLAAAVESLEGPADVVGLLYPRLPSVRIGESGLDDVQLRMMSFGHRAVQPGREPLHDASYCGRVVMNWTQIYDHEASLYLGVHDPAGTTTVHATEKSGLDGESTEISTRRIDEIAPGEKAIWETRLAVGSGGWHKGARLYGDWFTSVHGKADYPQWLLASSGWLDLQAENYGADFRFDNLGDWLTQAKAVGLDWVQVWGQFAYDSGPCCSAWYGPSPMYGGVEGWKRATQEIKGRGGHVGGYFIYDRFDRLPVWLDTFLGHYARADYGNALPWDTAEFQHAVAAVTDPAGTVPSLKPPQEEIDKYRAEVAEHRRLYGEGERAGPVQWWTTAYLPDPLWRDYLASWIGDRYVGAWGANAAYIDVLGTGDATIDYDPRRNHNGDGSWGLGRKMLAQEVVQRSRRHDPEFGLAMEGLGDLPGLHAAALCSGVYRGNRNVVRYTFPDRILIHGMANSGGSGTGGPLARYLTTFREAMRWDIVGRPTSLPAALLNLTRPFQPELYEARFLDTEGLRVSDPRIEARRFDATATALGCHVVTLTNQERIEGKVVLADPALSQVGAALGLALDGRLLTAARSSAAAPLEIPVDSSILAAIFLVPPADAARATVWPVLWPDWGEAGKGKLATVRLLNLSDKPQQAALHLDCLGYTDPFGERLPAEARVRYQRTVRVEPRQAIAVEFDSPAAVVDAYRDWTTRWEVSLPEHDYRREQLLTPPALDPSFDFLETKTGEGVDGRALELGPTTEGYQHRTVDLWLLPNRRYQLTFQSKRTGFKADVRGSLLRLHKGENDAMEDHRWALDPKRPGVWQKLGGEFTTPADLTRAVLYLYNVRSTDTAWFDEIRIEDLGSRP